jgi:hypothetical protein
MADKQSYLDGVYASFEHGKIWLRAELRRCFELPRQNVRECSGFVG